MTLKIKGKVVQEIGDVAFLVTVGPDGELATELERSLRAIEGGE